MKNLKVLDCTLRDGGYYNNWDFDEQLVAEYLHAAAKAEIDMIELGLRNFDSTTFKGANAFTSERYINHLKLPNGPLYGVMVDAKTLISSPYDIREGVDRLFVPKSESRLDFVRIAAHYHEIESAIHICRELKEYGYFVGLNLMQSVGKTDNEIIAASAKAYESEVIDVLYFADSLGNMDAQEQERIIQAIRQNWDDDIGLHAHDNTSQALSNTLGALDLGVTYIDATMTGMGRGAGNTKTEILLLELCRKHGSNYKPEQLHELILKHFEPMQRKYGWGTSLLYHIGASFNIHPTYIQQLYSDSRFGASERAAAIQYLGRIESSSYDGENLEKALNISKAKPRTQATRGHSVAGIFDNREVLIIGAGESTAKHQKAIKDYILEKKPVVIAININNQIPPELVDYYTATHNIKFLTDREKYKNFESRLIAPHSRFEENDISPAINYEVDTGHSWIVNDSYCIIPYELTLAYTLALCEVGKAEKISLVGFDGYPHLDTRNKESQETLDHFKTKIKITCLTPTNYNIATGSIYAI
ncbi:aldolase catalytic domain-containing protein [Pseudomonas sp. GCM10022188]|uniref:aldolase catalytic domain-containing protein n=1 Tax=Pseudomonas TaxID=286 RepID=UPI001E2C0A29|nr:aldolase catalytic domain-containing protein [Pseudomonas oryzagri]MCC6076903.1 aldolase catalytic domain-containing protein [Pseudomonas oryzagri]